MQTNQKFLHQCRWAGMLGLAVVTLLLARALPAEEPATAMPRAVTLSLRLPITGTRDTQMQTAILRQLDRLKSRPEERGVLVLRFDQPPAETVQTGSDLGRSLELARFLCSERLAGIKTVAFLPTGAAGHAVLVALACEEIVMAPDAVLGPANADEPLVDNAMQAAYRQIALQRKTVPPAVALALLDPTAQVARVSTDDGDTFVDAGHRGIKEKISRAQHRSPAAPPAGDHGSSRSRAGSCATVGADAR